MGPGNNANPNPPGQYVQNNLPGPGGHVIAHQGSGPQHIYLPPNQVARKRGPRTDTIVLLATVVFDVLFFFYGMLAYTGRNTGADEWRAGIFLLLLLVTGSMVRRWIRRRW